MRLLPIQQWAGTRPARDVYKPIGMPFYAESEGVILGRGSDAAAWHVYCVGAGGVGTQAVCFSWAKEEVDRLNVAVSRFFEEKT